jgi:hypothetical protein
VDLPAVAVAHQDIDLDEDAIEGKGGLVDDLGPLDDQRRSPLDLLGNVQPVVGNFGAAGEQLLGEYPDLGAGSKFGLKVACAGNSNAGGFLLSHRAFGHCIPLSISDLLNPAGPAIVKRSFPASKALRLKSWKRYACFNRCYRSFRLVLCKTKTRQAAQMPAWRVLICSDWPSNIIDPPSHKHIKNSL